MSDQPARWTSDVGGNLFVDDEHVGTFDSAYTAEIAAEALNALMSPEAQADYYELQQIRALARSVNDVTSWGVRRSAKKRVWERLRAKAPTDD